MRFVVMGAGAVGGVLGGRLALAGVDVHLVARGAHLEAIRAGGLRLQSPDGDVTVDVAASDLAGVRLAEGDVVLLAVKSQDTPAALAPLAAAAPPGVPVVCVQNGVANEREALRRFARVSGVCVMCPAAHLEPGVVAAYGTPRPGIFDVGRYPDGADDLDEAVADAFRSAGFGSRVVPDVMRWKYGKLVVNLANAVEAVCGLPAVDSEVTRRATAEGVAVLEAAGIPFVAQEEEAARRGDLRLRPAAGERRPGGSSWQSLARGLGSIETDHLTGEIVLLGRLHGVPTPVNETLQRLANAMAVRGDRPGAVPPEVVLAGG